MAACRSTCVTAKGNTLLHRAAGDGYNGALKTVDLLLDRNADPTLTNKAGKTVLDVATRECKEVILKRTTRPASADTLALLGAVAADDADQVATLLARGADPCAVDATSGKRWGDSGLSGVAALHVAMARGVSPKVVDLLLGHQPLDVNVRSADGTSALHLVLNFGKGAERDRVVARLLARGANVNARTDRGETPIFELCSFYKLGGELELVDVLLAAGAERDVVDGWGQRPLDKMYETASQRFHEVNDKAGFVAMIHKLQAAGFVASKGSQKDLQAWMASKGAKYLPAAPKAGGKPAAPEPKAAKPTAGKTKPTKTDAAAEAKAAAKARQREAFVALTKGKLAGLVDEETTLMLAGERRPVALFDWYTFVDEYRADQSDRVLQIAEYHVAGDAMDQVEAGQWIPFGVVGMNGHSTAIARSASTARCTST
jgi:hypothetical protein